MNFDDQFFIDSSADLPVDGKTENETITVFRYRDGWLILWKNPLSGKDLGRWVKTAEELKSMLRGHWNLGTIVTATANLK